MHSEKPLVFNQNLAKNNNIDDDGEDLSPIWAEVKENVSSIENIENIENGVNKAILNHENTIKNLKEEIIKLEQAVKENNDNLLRVYAEMENVRNRAKTDVEKAHKFGQESFIKSLLPVIDSLEKAVEKSADDVVLTEGVKLTLKMFLDELGKQNVVEINPVKEQFDPQNHSAMLVQPDNTVPNNTVLNVLQKGYKMFDRVIRPALVIVSKAD